MNLTTIIVELAEDALAILKEFLMNKDHEQTMKDLRAAIDNAKQAIDSAAAELAAQDSAIDRKLDEQ